jgi:outer membrane murein-binding lipoprotein Lpp
MAELERLAVQVVDRWERGDLAAAVRELACHLDMLRDDRIRYKSQIDAARETYATPSDNDIEVDTDAMVSATENGCWVSAWVMVREDDAQDGVGTGVEARGPEHG